MRLPNKATPTRWLNRAASRAVVTLLADRPYGELSWDAGLRDIALDEVPERYQPLAQAAADAVGKRDTITGDEFATEVWRGYNAIISEDRSFGVHTDPSSWWRLSGIGGNHEIEPHEAIRAAAKSPMAAALLGLFAGR